MTIIFWLEATTTRGTVSKGCSVKKVGDHRCNGIHRCACAHKEGPQLRRPLLVLSPCLDFPQQLSPCRPRVFSHAFALTTEHKAHNLQSPPRAHTLCPSLPLLLSHPAHRRRSVHLNCTAAFVPRACQGVPHNAYTTCTYTQPPAHAQTHRRRHTGTRKELNSPLEDIQRRMTVPCHNPAAIGSPGHMVRPLLQTSPPASPGLTAKTHM